MGQFKTGRYGNFLGETSMISALGIWSAAAILYAIFWLWYVGFRGKLSEAEVAEYLQRFESLGLAPDRLENLHHFLSNDDGREWFMVNLLEMKAPKRESIQLLRSYTKIFLGGLLKRGGHPFFVANAQAKNIESLHSEQANNWDSIGLVRYRSRRDLAEMLLDTFGSEHHANKLASLEKTFAFPATTGLLLGSPRVLVPMGLALIAALTQIALL
jgi:hypothetical protein